MNLDFIFSALPLRVNSYKPVSGGDINNTFYIEASEGNYFIKLNQAEAYPQMFKKEANGLFALEGSAVISVPKIIDVGEIERIQYLLMEWIDKGKATADFWSDFGDSLANLHKIPQPYFGFGEDNYIGSLKQDNTKCSSWEEFYTEYRILPLVKILVNQNKFQLADNKIADNFCNRIKELFPKESSSLVHGDLWNGNYLVSDKGKAVLIDPAAYYGHREMDLGMTRLFGGFPSHFYEAYNETYPLEKCWESRLPYTQLYPILVHAILFGGSYITEAKNILRKF